MKLDKKMAGKINRLSVTNQQGTTEYKFKLELGDKPPAGKSQRRTSNCLPCIVPLLDKLPVKSISVKLANGNHFLHYR